MEAGTKFKREIVRCASEQSGRIYAAMIRLPHSPVKDEKLRREDLLFDPTRPVQTDWEQVLAKVAEKLVSAKKQKA